MKFKTDTDALVAVREATDEDHVVMVSKGGRACRFKPSETKEPPDGSIGFTVKVQGRVTAGVRGMRLKEGDSVVRTMKLDDEHGDEIVRVHTIPDLGDQLFLLTGKGMMIRVRADQTKETTGKATKGTRVMELRDREKGGFVDEIIFSARLPADLIDDDLVEINSSEEE